MEFTIKHPTFGPDDIKNQPLMTTKTVGVGLPQHLIDELDAEFEDKKVLTNKEQYFSLKVMGEKAYAVDSVTRQLIEVRDVELADLGLSGDFYSHRAIKGGGFVVSEGQTCVMLASGETREQALAAGRKKVRDYVLRNGDEAFYALLLKQRLPEDNPRYIEQVEEVMPEVIPEQEPQIVKEVKPTDLPAAIEISLNFKNMIDLDYISEMLEIEPEIVRERILAEDLGFENPENNMIEAPDEYLSGNVRYKLEVAETAAERTSDFEKNIVALKKIIPEDIPSSLIQYTIGAAWIPLKVYERFSTDMFKTKTEVLYHPNSGKFSAKTRLSIKTVQITNTYAAGTKNGMDIFNATLNNQQIIVTEQVHEDGRKKTVKNLEYTSAAQGMQDQMQEEFQAFIRANRDIQDETEKIYNRVFNGFIDRGYRLPSFDYYPGASKAYKMRDHQKKGVLRGLNESTLFAHSVGTGKSILIITTAMEMRRLGLAKKPMIAVQNKTRGQFLTTFHKLYPDAKILAPDKDELSAAGKSYLYQRIADEDWDAIIMPHSQFDLIPDDINRQRRMIKKSLDEANEVLSGINKKFMPLEYAHSNRMVKMLIKELEALDIEEEMRRKNSAKAEELFGVMPLLNFEQMNVDALLIDEHHRYKRLGLYSAMSSVRGIDTAKSKRSQSILLKIRWVQENNNGKNALGYTGTPISNTMAEAWTMIRYFRPDILKQMGIEHFDQFAKTFGQVVPSLEQTGGGTFKIQSRFAKFQNLPEFIAAFRATADVVLAEDVREFNENNTIPLLKGGKITQQIIPQYPELKEQIAEFRKTLEWYDELEGMEKRMYNYIPLVIFGKAKQAAIDLRLLSPANPDIHSSKVNRVIKNALKVYFDTGGVQMIFSDLYQSPEPKEAFLDEDCQVPNPAYGMPRFNLFNDIRDKLVANGIKPNEIALMSESKWDKPEKLEQLFIDANAGRIKFLVGSTERLGVGINAQERLIAVHHIDAPARPMDFEQRNGRILRQGNLNKEVWIFAYGVEKTLDSAAFQRLSTKQKFINQIMKGVNVERITEDPADEAQMTFDEMMACLSDSPYAQQKLLVDNRLRAEKTKRDNFFGKQVQTQRQLNYAEEELTRLRLDVKEDNENAEVVTRHFPDGVITQVEVGGETFNEHFGAPVDAYCDMLIERYNESVTLSARGYILVNDIKFHIQIDNVERISHKTKMLYNAPSMSYTVPEMGIYPNRYDQGIPIQSNSGTGLLFSLKYKINDAIEAPRYTLSKIHQHEIAIEELKRTMNAEFDETKLFQLEAESEELKRKMVEESSKPQVIIKQEEFTTSDAEQDMLEFR